MSWNCWLIQLRKKRDAMWDAMQCKQITYMRMAEFLGNLRVQLCWNISCIVCVRHKQFKGIVWQKRKSVTPHVIPNLYCFLFYFFFLWNTKEILKSFCSFFCFKLFHCCSFKIYFCKHRSITWSNNTASSCNWQTKNRNKNL